LFDHFVIAQLALPRLTVHRLSKTVLMSRKRRNGQQITILLVQSHYAK
jgi:hypothetical protein